MPAEADLLPDDSVLAVQALAEAFDARSVRYALIGGLAFMLRGRPRYTRDVDFLVDVPQIALPALLDDLVERGFSLDRTAVIQQYVREYATSFPYGRVRIGRLKPVLPLYSRTLAEAEPLEWTGGHIVPVATAEGLILTRLISFRPQDQVDIETLLTASRDTIDIDHIRREWSDFAASEPDRTAWLEATIARRVVRRE